MNVITKNPIIVNKQKVDYPEKYLNVTADEGHAAYTPTQAEIDQNKQKGLFWDKVKGVWKKAKDIGLIDKIGSLFGLDMTKLDDSGTGSGSNNNNNNFDDQPTGMSTGAKIAIAVGVIAAIGTVIYFATREPKGK